MKQATGVTPRITRHPVNVDGVTKQARSLAEDMPDAVSAARKDLAHCNSLRMDALDHAAQLMVLSPASPDIWGSLHLGAEAVVAIFAGAMATGDEVEVALGELPLARVPAAIPSSSHHVGNWMDGFFMAAICREKGLLDLLCRVPIELLRRSTTRGLEHTYLIAEALQSYWRREGDSAERARAALLATEDRGIPSPAIHATRELSRPELEVILRLIEGQAEPFNEAVAGALVLHRQYWSRGEELARDPRGYFSLSVTGLSALAHDAGIAVTVESDYLPMALVRGDRQSPA